MPTHTLQRLPLTAGRSRPDSVLFLWRRLWNFLSRDVAGAGRLSMRLHAEQVLRLNDAAGWTVACLRGSLWITQETDNRDVFLDAGDSFTLDRAGLALILATRNAAVIVRPPTGRGRQAVRASPDSDRAPGGDSAREVWLKAVYPECGPWNDPAAYRRSGLI